VTSKKKFKTVRVVSVSEPTQQPDLPPYRVRQEVVFWHPNLGRYRGRVIAALDNDAYTVELGSGKKFQVNGAWIKTRRPEDDNGN
jgi:hypothetical protein